MAGTRYLVIRQWDHKDGSNTSEPVAVARYMSTAVAYGISRESADRKAGIYSTAYRAELIEDIDLEDTNEQ